MTHTFRAISTHPNALNGPAQGQLGTGPNKAERAKEREAILRQMEAGSPSEPRRCHRQDAEWEIPKQQKLE